MRKIRKNTESDTNFLADLALWRNDPDKAREIIEYAKAGNPDAQYALGLLYAEGRGIEQDESKAYYWLSQAIDQGDEDAKILREVVQQQMTLEQINVIDDKLKTEKMRQTNA